MQIEQVLPFADKSIGPVEPHDMHDRGSVLRASGVSCFMLGASVGCICLLYQTKSTTWLSIGQVGWLCCPATRGDTSMTGQTDCQPNCSPPSSSVDQRNTVAAFTLSNPCTTPFWSSQTTELPNGSDILSVIASTSCSRIRLP